MECTETGCVYVHGGQASPPATHFKQISRGLYHTCGVTLDGNVDCWGYNPNGERPTGLAGIGWRMSGRRPHLCAPVGRGRRLLGRQREQHATDRIGPFTHVSGRVAQLRDPAERWQGRMLGRQPVRAIQSAGPRLRADRPRQPAHVRDTGRQQLAKLDRVLGLQLLRPGQAGTGRPVQTDRLGQGPYVRSHLHKRVILLGAEQLRAGECAERRRPGRRRSTTSRASSPRSRADPVLNVVKSGSAVPLKFSLSGDEGLKVIEADYPASLSLNCQTINPSDDLQLQPKPRAKRPWRPTPRAISTRTSGRPRRPGPDLPFVATTYRRHGTPGRVPVQVGPACCGWV